MDGKREISFSDGIMIYIFAIVANLAMQVLISIVLGIGSAMTGNSQFGQGTYAQLACMILLQVAFASVPFFYYGANKKAVKMLVAPAARNNKADPVLGLILPFLAMLGFFLPAQLFELFLLDIGYNPSAGIELVTAGQWGLGILTIVIIAPVVEEFIFRGFLLGGLKKSFNPYIAALLSALAFSFMHMNPEQTVYQLCLGYVCALAALKSNTMVAPVMIHSVSNLIALTANEPLELFFTGVFSLPAWGIALVTIALMLACGAAIFFICYAMGKSQKSDNAEQPRKADNASESSQAESQNGGNAEPESSQATDGVPLKSGKSKIRNISKTTGMMIYIGSIGLCFVMWILVFVMSLM